MKQGKKVEELKQRKKHCCCKYCGNSLELRRMVFSEDDDARVELYCPECCKIEFGVECEIYAVAEYFVEELGFECYSDIDNPTLQKQMNIAKVAEIISWGFVNLGYIDVNGFCYPKKIPDELLHEALNIKLTRWQAYKEVIDDDITN